MLLIILAGGWLPTRARADFEHRVVTVMTQNMDEGTGFGPILAATTLPQFLTAVATTYAEVQAGNIPERAVAVAREIGQVRPDLVGLQEAAQYRIGSVSSPGATTVTFDQLQSLLTALSMQGLSYAPIAIATNLDIEVPSAFGYNIRFTDRDVLLARTGNGERTPELSNIQVHHYATATSLTSPVVGSLTLPKSWISVDATIEGRTFRFVTTHLDTVSPDVQVAQGNELLQGAGTTNLPVVFSGDFNSDAGGGTTQTATYGNLIAAGFADAWTATHPDNPGYTWPLHLEDPLTAFSVPTDRIDLVLARNGVRALATELIGNRRDDLTPSGLWPSDHAGVVAVLQIQCADRTGDDVALGRCLTR
jgi:endonuclease/exonuclease/phosphatase family metal-dependent hydrolase